jgi:diguanylate cyclase (GGDEF)-like protein
MWQFMRGHTDEAQRWYEQGAARLAAGTGAEGAAFSTATAIIPAQFGSPAQAATRLEVPRSFLAANADNLVQRVNLLVAGMVIAVEQGEVGAPFEDMASEFESLKLASRNMLGEQCVFFVHQAMGRLAQCRQATSDTERSAALRRARRAVRQLGRAVKNPLLRAHHLVVAADLELVSGRPAVALRRLAAAEPKLRLDAPLVEYEAARIRARALRALGEPAMADRQARQALALAERGRWLYRARWIRAEFNIAAAPTAGTRSAGGNGRSSSGAVHQRRLAALQQVSHAAATVLDPDQVARIALDETVRILGAERAYLYLCDDGELVPHLGRDADGRDIRELTGHGSTLVERVRDTREALVVTGTDEGAALGSQSALVHGLRSILIAPVQLDGRLLGVVYLDSRVAKGVFSADDVDLLTAITSHVAVSLETARAAQLEVAVHAAQRQRDVAETLRGAMAALTATLDPAEVIRRLLGTLAQMLPGESAALLVRDRDTVVLAAACGQASAAPGSAVGVPSEPWLADLLEVREPGPVTAVPGNPLGRLLGGARHVLAFPVVLNGDAGGVVVIGSNEDVIDVPQIHVVAALVEQGMTAYENARLFSQVRRMATVDGLSGLYNRAHFFDEANRRMEVARRYRRPIAALMLDVDNFKRINDTYGHAIGDEVIREVAARLRDSARDCDLLGRYGGEEFAILAPETGAAATALAERLRAAVSAEPVLTEVGPVTVTISVGVAHTDDGGCELSAVLASADEALYQAKRSGRNRVVSTYDRAVAG